MVRTLLPTQAATSLPRLTPSSHQALNPPHTSTPTSDWYTWVTVGWNGAVGCGFIGKSGACREICCWEQPFALDSPSNHQSQLGGGGEKKKKKKHPSTASSTRCQRGTRRCQRFLHRQWRPNRHQIHWHFFFFLNWHLRRRRRLLIISVSH